MKQKKLSNVILVDTREQTPIWFLVCRKFKLDVGDYTTERLLNKFHIERKSPQDLYQSIIQNHFRFVNMLCLAKSRRIKIAIYVECTREKFVTLQFPKGHERKMRPETLDKITATMETRYEFVWCKDRDDLKRKIKKRLKLETK